MQDRVKPQTEREITIALAAFKVRGQSLVEAVAGGKLDRVVLTKRGRPGAQITAVAAAIVETRESSYGFMRDQIRIDPAWDPTEPMTFW